MLSHSVAKRVTSHMLQLYGFDGYFNGYNTPSTYHLRHHNREGKGLAQKVRINFKFPR